MVYPKVDVSRLRLCQSFAKRRWVDEMGEGVRHVPLGCIACLAPVSARPCQTPAARACFAHYCRNKSPY
jgi:hypothetical protein